MREGTRDTEARATAMFWLEGHTITEVLFEGDVTTLYRGYRDVDGAPVLVKALNDDYPLAKDVARLRHEFLVMRGLDLPAVPAALGLVPCRNGAAIVLSDSGKRPLVERMREGRLEIGPALRLGAAIARALEGVHLAGIIHKDIGPPNVLVDEETLEVELMGFGHATRLSQEDQRLAAPGTLEGTLAYMAPEQTGRMNRVVDHRADLYALGVTLYELFTGSLPFAMDDPLGLVHAHIARAPAPPRELASDLPRAASDIVIKLLAKSADDRYQRARGVEADLAECAAQWEERGFVAPFPLGAHDLGENLVVPQKLYGREAERRELFTAFEAAVSGRLGLVVVTGPGGAGKSALVRELSRPTVARKGYFAAGGSDALAKGAPCAAMSAALSALVRQILAGPTEPVCVFVEELLRAFEPHGAPALGELVPELAVALGDRAPPVPLPATESQERLAVEVRALLAVAATRERPVVLFLDDLDDADRTSIDLVRALVADGSQRHLLLVVAHRDRAEEARPSPLDLRELGRGSVRVTEIALGPLPIGPVRRLLADAVGAPEERVASLADALLVATHGSPFFLREVLRALHAEGFVRFDTRAGAFTWDVELVRRRLGAAEARDFIRERIEALPRGARELVALAACLGQQFDLATLSLAAGRPAPRVAVELWPALEEGLVLPLSSDYCLASVVEEGGPPSAAALREIPYAFSHAHVRDAAGAFVPAEERPALHLRIGRLLVAREGRGIEAAPFAAVRQLNLGASAIVDPEERLSLAKLDLLAGRRAKAAGAFADAMDCFAAGLDAIGERDDVHDLWFTLRCELGECAVAFGPADAEIPLDEELTRRARTPTEQAMACKLRVTALVARQRPLDALAAGIEGLALLGIRMPEEEEEQRAAIAKKLRSIDERLQGRTIASLVFQPRAGDPATVAAMDLLHELFTPAYIASGAAARLIIVELVELSILHGHVEASAFAYVAYGMLLAVGLDRPEEGLAFGDLALALEEEPGGGRLACRVHLTYGAMSHVRRPRRLALIHFLRAAEGAIACGDLPCLSFATAETLAARFDLGDDLARACDEAERHLALVRGSRDRRVALGQAALLCLQTARCLLGRTSGRTSLTDDTFDEASYARSLETSSARREAFLYHALRTQLSLLHEDFPSAARHALEAAARTASIAGQFAATDHSFYFALALLLDRTAAPDERAARLAQVDEHIAVLARSAELCPENFERKWLLVSAERARAAGDELSAMTLFEKAIRAAAESGVCRDEALANELAARFHLDRRRDTVARAYMAEAYQAYLRWGATTKVEQLRERYGFLLPRRAKAASVARAAEVGASPGLIDLRAMMRATQAIADEVALEPLLDRVLRVIVESAGAQRAVLLLDRGAGLAVEAAMMLDPDRVLLGSAAAADVGWELPESVVEEVGRTRKAVVLGGSKGYDRFSEDPYLMEQRPRSLLCLAMAHRGRLLGVLVLENRFVEGAFSPARVEVALFVASQAAIAVENALLVANNQRLGDSLRRATERLEHEVVAHAETIERELAEKARAQEEKRALLDAMQAAEEARRAELSTPLLPITDEVVVMPLIGTFDEERAERAIAAALAGVGASGASVLIIDITGVQGVNARVVEALVGASRAIGLLGAEVVITGVRASVARMLLELGTDVGGLVTRTTLKGGIAYAFGRARARFS
ncbi:AAA family ATPase [Polyangium aurulentum]|uniref:AAA family ATPase n=1 Tax=Polyangium aurulentum TaxID=2567896 RepID=UPI0010AEA6AC|nr:AAA family ATPase [Polyangium aurulentum]UQA60706.1 AAA family ATPase [Polyangium aurulentum]